LIELQVCAEVQVHAGGSNVGFACTGVTAQVVVVGLHVMFLVLFFAYQSNLKTDIQTGDLAYPVIYFLFIAVSLALYFVVGFKNPGYVVHSASETGMMLADQDVVRPVGKQSFF
jgi:hypothetical protein